MSAGASLAWRSVRCSSVTGTAASLFHLPVQHGLLVETVKSGSAASNAGLLPGKQRATVAGVTYPLGGDLIENADGVPLSSIDQLRDLISDKKPGQTVKLSVYRSDKHRTVTVKLGRQPSSPQS